MKNTFFFLLLLISFKSFSQTLPKVVHRSSSAVTVSDARFQAPLNLYIPHVCDTLTALNGGLDSLGAIILDTCNHIFYIRDGIGTTHKWLSLNVPGGSNTQILFNDFGVFGGSPGLVYNKTAHEITTDSVIAKKAKIDTIRAQVTIGKSNKNAYIFGTSISKGYQTQDAFGSLDTTRRWSTYVCRSLGWIENNYGIPGEVLQSRSPIVTNMVDNGIPIIPHYNSVTDTAIFFEFSINDCTKTGQGLTNYNTTNFITDYTRVIDTAKARGWPVGQIFIIGSNYVDTSINTNNTYTSQIAYWNATKTVATNESVNFIDVFTNSFINRNSFFYSDLLHPSNTGHSIYAIKVLSAIGATVVKNAQTVAANGVTELQQLNIKQTDTTDVKYQVVGIDQYNHAIKVPNGYFIENNPLVTQYGGINLAGYQSLYTNNLGTVQRVNAGLTLANSTAATNGGQQISPPLYFNGKYWSTDSSSSQPVSFRWEAFTFQGTGGSNRLQLLASKNGLAYNHIFNITQDGSAVRISESNSNQTTLTIGSGDVRMNVAGVYDIYGGNVMNFRYGGGSSYRYTLTAANIYGTSDIILQGVPAASTGFDVFESVSAAGIALSTQGGSFPIVFATNRAEKMRLSGTGNLGIGTNNPTAVLHLKAGTATPNTAPLKFTAGTNLPTPEDGAIEYDGTDYYATVSTTRYILNKGLSGSATLDFPSTNAQTNSDLTITVTGAADGDMVVLGVPNGSTLTNSSFTAWVSATNTVTVRFNNYSSGALDPASGTFKVRVIK